jgi:hypothetical protein
MFSDKDRDEIISKYDELSDEVGEDDIVELETRFGTFVEEKNEKGESFFKFENDIGEEKFLYLLSSFGFVDPVVTKEISYNATKLAANGETVRFSYRKTGNSVISKIKQNFDDITGDYDLRISLARESPESPSNIKNLKGVVREKTRYIYPRGNSEIHLTEVKQGRYYQYELEIEFTDDNLNANSFDDYMRTVSEVFGVLYSTNNMYSLTERYNLVQMVNSTLGGNTELDEVDKSLYVQSRNLQYKDLVCGGIVGNPNDGYTVTEKADGERGFLIIDDVGIWIVNPPHRYDLVIRKDNISLTLENENLYEDLEGSIFDGEDVPTSRRIGDAEGINSKYFFVVFDTLRAFDKTVQNTNDVRNEKYVTLIGEPHQTRVLYNKSLNALNDIGIGDTLFIKQKDFLAIDSINDFFNKCSELLDKPYPYEIDGLIFTPSNSPYITPGSRQPLKSRVLTHYSDICKWKFAMSVDLMIGKRKGQKNDRRLYTFNCEKFDKGPKIGRVKGYELFTGDMSKRIDPDKDYFRKIMLRLDEIESGTVVTFKVVKTKRDNKSRTILKPVRLTNDEVASSDEISRSTINLSVGRPGEEQGRKFLYYIKDGEYVKLNMPYYMNLAITNLNDLPQGTVVEFEWSSNDQLLIPIRVRYDKEGHPNSKDVALNNWKYMYDPLVEKTITGRNIKLMSRYHNQIKRDLFEKLPAGETLLDIASGRGGDVWSWKRFSKVVAVEPNKENIKELKSRLKSANMEDKVLVVNAFGQDTVKITNAVKKHLGGKADNCSIMLGLSFFWENEKILASLIKSIKNNVKNKFIFMTIDGNGVDEMFNPVFGKPNIDREILVGLPEDNNYFRLNNDETVSVNFEGTIVPNQKEYKVYLEDLMLHFDLEYITRSDKKTFLNPGESLLTSMYSYGMFNVTKKVTDVPKSKPKPKIIIKTKKKEKDEEPKIPAKSDKTIKPITPNNPHLSSLYKDGIEKLNFDWYDNDVVRIFTLGEGDCFFHALLNAFYPPYQEAKNDQIRRTIIRKFRKDVAGKLRDPDPSYSDFAIEAHKDILYEEGDTNEEVDAKYEQAVKDGEVFNYEYWETSNNGFYIDALTLQLMSPDMAKEQCQDPADVKSMVNYIKSKGRCICELYIFAISDILNIDIVLLRARKSPTMQTNTLKNGRDRPIVTILWVNPLHYELLGVVQESGIQTIFKRNDRFIESLIVNLRVDIEDYVMRDPEDNYRNTIINNFTSINRLDEEGGILIPSDMMSKLDDDDPYVMGIYRVFNEYYDEETKEYYIPGEDVKQIARNLHDKGYSVKSFDSDEEE